MKLNVTGVETVEITDPAGLSDQPQQTVYPKPNPGIQPAKPAVEPWDIFDDMKKKFPSTPAPQVPTPINPNPLPKRPWGPGERVLPHTKWEHKHNDRWQRSFTGDPPEAILLSEDGQKWARGMSAAYRAGEENIESGHSNKSYQT